MVQPALDDSDRIRGPDRRGREAKVCGTCLDAGIHPSNPGTVMSGVAAAIRGCRVDRGAPLFQPVHDDLHHPPGSRSSVIILGSTSAAQSPGPRLVPGPDRYRPMSCGRPKWTPSVCPASRAARHPAFDRAGPVVALGVAMCCGCSTARSSTSCCSPPGSGVTSCPTSWIEPTPRRSQGHPIPVAGLAGGQQIGRL